MRLLVIWMILLPCAAAHGQEEVPWTAWAEQYSQQVRVVLQAELPFAEPGAGQWRMYALDSPAPSRAVSVSFESLPAALTANDAVRQTGVQGGYDPYWDKSVRFFEGRALLWSDFGTEDSVIGESVRGQIEYMICNDRICLPPTTVLFEAVIAAAPEPFGATPAARVLATAPTVLTLPADEFQVDWTAQRSGGLWGFLLLAVGAGLGAFLMPCVYPMIPLTVSFFTQHESQSPVRMALAYGAAIVANFTGLGVLLSALVGGAGAQSLAANPWVNCFIAIAFLAFGLSLLGLYELRLPSGIVNWMDRRGRSHSQYMGVLFMGITLTLVSFSCTVPFVGLLLPSIAAGDWFYGIVGMSAFSATFALPFAAFACFPHAMKALPAAGGWMRVVSVVFGFIELAAALKFFSNADLVWGLGLISRPLAIAITAAIVAMAGLYLIGQLRLQGDPSTSTVSAGRLLWAVAFFGLTLYLIPGLFGGRLGRLDAYLPPKGESEWVFGEQQEQDWITDDIDTAVLAAEEQDRPMFIDFTGYTCTNCREMEVNVFGRGEIAQTLSDDFVLLRLYTDGPRDREYQQFQLDVTGTRALPTYAVVRASAPKQPLVQLSGVVSRDQFAAFLEAGLGRYTD